MSHIVRFSVEGLAGRKSPVSAVLNRDVNIFFGLNGSGKSSLLKILHSAMARDASILKNVPFTHAEVTIYTIAHDREISYRISKKSKPGPEQEIGDETRSPVTLIKISEDEDLAWTDDFATDTKAWNHSYLPTSRLYINELVRTGRTVKGATFGANELLSEESLDEQFAKGLELIWRDYYTRIILKVREAQDGGLANLLKAVLTGIEPQTDVAAGDIADAYHRVKSFLIRQGGGVERMLGSSDSFAIRHESDPEFRRVVADLVQVDKNVEKANQPIRDLQSLVNRVFSGRKSVELIDGHITVKSESGSEIGLSTLSSGEKHFLRIFVAVLRIGNSSIMIDEPEISLHIDWQKEFITALHTLNPTCQLIIATHSPEVMASVDDAKIFRL